MGTTTDAILFYGLPLGDVDDDADLEGLLMDAIGAPPALPANDAGLTYVEWIASPQYEPYCTRRDERRAALEASGLNILLYCSSDCPMAAVVVTQCTRVACRGENKIIHPHTLVTPDDLELLHHAATKLGADPAQLNGWYLVSDWC